MRIWPISSALTKCLHCVCILLFFSLEIFFYLFQISAINWLQIIRQGTINKLPGCVRFFFFFLLWYQTCRHECQHATLTWIRILFAAFQDSLCRLSCKISSLNGLQRLQRRKIEWASWSGACGYVLTADLLLTMQLCPGLDLAALTFIPFPGLWMNQHKHKMLPLLFSWKYRSATWGKLSIISPFHASAFLLQYNAGNLMFYI